MHDPRSHRHDLSARVGPPEETIELTLRLSPEFARTGDEAHERILDALRGHESFGGSAVGRVAGWDTERGARGTPDHRRRTATRLVRGFVSVIIVTALFALGLPLVLL